MLSQTLIGKSVGINKKLLCSHKLDGALSLQDIVCFNKALIAKQCWKLHLSYSSIFQSYFKGAYYQESFFKYVSQQKKSSLAWKSLLWARELAKSCVG